MPYCVPFKHQLKHPQRNLGGHQIRASTLWHLLPINDNIMSHAHILLSWQAQGTQHHLLPERVHQLRP
jgi:hypothetical protein